MDSHRKSFNLSDARRRIANLVMIGTIVEVDAAAVRARVRIGDMTTALLPWISPRAAVMNVWTAPAIGEQVMVVSHNGDPAQGVIIGSLHSHANPSPSSNTNLFKIIFSDGSYVEHDTVSRAMKIGCTGKVEVDADGDIQAVTAGRAKITAVGDVEINTQASLKAVAAASAAVTAPAINLTGAVTIAGPLTVTGPTVLQQTTVEETVLHSPNNLF